MLLSCLSQKWNILSQMKGHYILSECLFINWFSKVTHKNFNNKHECALSNARTTHEKSQNMWQAFDHSQNQIDMHEKNTEDDDVSYLCQHVHQVEVIWWNLIKKICVYTKPLHFTVKGVTAVRRNIEWTFFCRYIFLHKL